MADLSSSSTDAPNDTTLENCLREAEELKQEGNEHFRASQWNEALVSYRGALARLPNRKESQTLPIDEADPDEELDLHPPRDTKGTAPEHPAIDPPSELELECSKARAVLNANIGACLVKVEDHKGVVEACTQALLDDPKYIKALQRRAASNEKIDTWSSLSRAQEDYTALLELLPPSSLQLAQVKRSLQSLKPRQEAAQKRETDEMMSKLKGLGNSILGNFGLSTDNFKFEPNGQGGYSMNFSR
ncbi:hypothetical protein BV22DRAFT_1034674 [Leucogyrophana mollusca]|uniref:Uncharacterized protein n=1 Tax=Leucogyrophana mollusca TaxID=85980 RepID=A0ACB8BJ85_9AGAM|nr:hypothetical protein BV22DRAFT_1034674 [Leucogyrophana mollusca]